MSYYTIVKYILSAAIVVAVSEISKKYTLLGAAIASLPLTSLLAMIWIYSETKDTNKISELSSDIFWLVIPSLILFIVLPLLLKLHYNFYLSLFISCVLTAIGYSVTIFIKTKFS